MCEICGCGQSGEARKHSHGAGGGHAHHAHDHGVGHDRLHFGANAAGVSVAGVETQRLVELQTSLLAGNEACARQVRAELAACGAVAVNLLSSPGSGKTSLLVRSLEQLLPDTACLVIEGDQQTRLDADRIAATGAPALQVNTGKGCHLDAHMVLHALERRRPPEGGLVLIENVGNLVCPAGFDLGERHKVVVLSVTEGEDKPLKYPDAFHRADLLVISKIDLLPHLDFDLARCRDYARQINPDIRIIELSARSGEGMAQWLGWLRALVA